MLDLKTGEPMTPMKSMTRGGFLKGILAAGIAPSVTLAVSTANTASTANAGVGRGMMRGVGARMATNFGGSSPHTYLPYLHVGSGQYLDPNIMMSQTPTTFDEIDASLRVTALSEAYDAYFGCLNYDGSKGVFIRRNNLTNYINYGAYFTGSFQGNFASETLPFQGFKSCGIRRSANNGVVYFGSSSNSLAINNSNINNFPFTLGALPYSGIYIGTQSQFDIAYLTFTRNGTQTHDFRPVINRDDNRCCFYDEVTKLYHYSAAGGDFTYP